MREIKFRGKRLDNGEWIYGYYSKLKFSDEVTGSYIDESDGINHPVDPKTVSQYTGLCDKHGKVIYEGDIFKDYDNYLYEVVYKHATFYAQSGAETLMLQEFLYKDDSCDIEVFGNIHDNPELFNVTKNYIKSWER